MRDEDFEDALARAVHGEVLTDLGASAEALEALVRVAAARTAAERRQAVRTARLLHERESDEGGAEAALLDGLPPTEDA